MLTGWRPGDIDDMLFYGVLGVILGGRLGYVLFYKPLHYLAHPLEIFQVWQGGMSFHGGFLGVLIALWFYAQAPQASAGSTSWISSRRWSRSASPPDASATSSTASWSGRRDDVPWAMVFPQVDNVPRHPSQLYQLGLEGLLLFVILWSLREPAPADGRGVGAVPGGLRHAALHRRVRARARRFPRAISRCGFTMGQWLSLPMIVAGVAMMVWAYRRAGKDEPTLLDRLK